MINIYRDHSNDLLRGHFVLSDIRVLFVLPTGGGSGGANSVVQEAIGLRSVGITADVAIDTGNYDSFVFNYPTAQQKGLRLAPYLTIGCLSKLMEGYSVAVATKNASLSDIEAARKGAAKAIRVAYYVQDYEPLFYAPDTDRWKQARASYTRIPDSVLFAKTNWLQNIVYLNHSVKVRKVKASIDHSMFFPDFQRQPGRSILAMLRPQTARRAPRRTVRVLQKIVQRYGTDVKVQVFGSDDGELQARGYELPQAIVNRGVLKQHQVPELMRESDLFLDLSDYQAFGRTGLESMASGCIPVVPIFGGTDEYACDGHNSFLVDTRSDDNIIDVVDAIIRMSDSERREIVLNGVETASRYTIQAAALSELRVFEEMHRTM